MHWAFLSYLGGAFRSWWRLQRTCAGSGGCRTTPPDMLGAAALILGGAMAWARHDGSHRPRGSPGGWWYWGRRGRDGPGDRARCVPQVDRVASSRRRRSFVRMACARDGQDGRGSSADLLWCPRALVLVCSGPAAADVASVRSELRASRLRQRPLMQSKGRTFTARVLRGNTASPVLTTAD